MDKIEQYVLADGRRAERRTFRDGQGREMKEFKRPEQIGNNFA